MGGDGAAVREPLILVKVEVEGFVSYLARTELELRGGALAMVGEIGSGKSTLVSKALAWGLYGKCAPERMGSGTAALRGADVVCDGAKECQVVLWFQRGATLYRVERTRKRAGSERVEVEIDGAPVTVTPETVIGAGYDVFVRTVLRGQADPWAFAEATDARKREIVDAVSGSDWLDPVHDRAKARRNAVLHRAGNLDAALGVAQRNLAALPSEVDARRAAAAWAENRDRELIELRSRLEGATAARAQAQALAARTQAELDALGVQPVAMDTKPYHEALRSASEHRATAQQLQRQAAVALNQVRGLHGLGECPTCGQSVEGKVAAWETDAHAQVGTAGDHHERAAALEKKAYADLQQATDWNTQQATDWARKRAAIQVPDLRALDAEVSEFEIKLKATEGWINPHEGQALAASHARVRAEREVAALEAERGILARDLAIVDAWLPVLAPKGLRAHLGEAALSAIETQANRWLAVLTGGTQLISIRPTKKNREQIDVVVLTRTAAGQTLPRNLLQFSGGERAKVNLAIDLGVAAAFTGGAGLALSLLVLDENVFSGLDAAGKRAIVDAINAVGVHDVVVIDHDPTLTGVLDRTVHVRKGGDGYSVIEEVA